MWFAFVSMKLACREQAPHSTSGDDPPGGVNQSGTQSVSYSLVSAMMSLYLGQCGADLSHWTRGSTKAGLQNRPPYPGWFVRKADQVDA